MADTGIESSQEQKDDDKTKKNILEEKSKDELIKLVKKYLGLLHKSKNKTDILNAKCSALEQEKDSLIQEHQSKEKELQNKIDDLQHTISQYKAEKVPLSENILENELFKQKLKESKDKIQSLLVQENEEQLHCLNLQLQTLKASCQCIQEENLKLQKSLKEKLEENSLLLDKNEILSSKLSKKAEEYELLFGVKENTQKNYEKSVDEIHSLQTEVKKLMNENNSLQESHKELSSEIQELRKSTGDSSSSDWGSILSDLQKYQDENEKLRKQIQSQKESKSSTVTENEIDNSNFTKVSSELRKETYDSLVQRKIELEEENKNLQSELDNCRQQIHELQNEIGNIVKAYQIDDYKMGIELALLHGASSDKIICPVEPLDSKKEISQFKSSEVKEENNGILNKTEYYPFVEGASGLEFALLQGGDASNLIAANAELASDMYMFASCNEAINIVPEPNSDDTAIDYKELLEKYESLCNRYEAEKKTLQKNLDEYSSLCHDTMKENDELKQELEDLRNKVTKIVHHQQTNTEPKYLNYPEETDSFLVSTSEISTSKDQIKSCQNCSKLCNEIVNFYDFIQSHRGDDSELEKSNVDYLMLLEKMKYMFGEMATDLRRKKSELNEYNLQLELFVIGIKQGVRQKNSNYQAKNNPEENVNALKMHVEDLVSKSSCFDSKLQMIQSETNSKIQEMEDQINQLRELNQFLEDENSELSVEVEKLKSSLNDSTKDLTNYTEGTYLQNTELYSIDESCELDNKTDANCNIQLDKETVNASDIFVQVCPLIQDCAVQTETILCSGKGDKITKDIDIQTKETVNASDIFIQVCPLIQDCAVQTETILCSGEGDKITKDIDIQTKETVNASDVFIQVCPLIQDCAVQTETILCSGEGDKITKDIDIQTEEENYKIIEQLKNDNEYFKKIADEKSNLVESIHCQMDSLLMKVEELTVELQNKEDDLKQMKHFNANLEIMLSEAENLKNQQLNNLKVVQDLVLDYKRKNLDLTDDVKSFYSTFKEMISNVQIGILNSINENSKNIDSVTEMCNHKENNLAIIENWILELAAEFRHWLSCMDQMTLESSLNLNEIASLVENASPNVSLFNKICEDTCCSISESINTLNSDKLKLFSAFYNHLNNCSSLVKEIHSYKMDVIPQMEKRLAECTCKNKSEVQVEIESVQEQTSEESLKNTLAETEIKMNKVKQIAVKLKKELASTKEQFNDVLSEKEKLQKKNAELLDELNKLTEDQCKYVQNYQTLQNEFDKLQDDCEMHKGSVKKLEDDLAIKLHELSSAKEQLADLEKQLKSSKNLIETNLSVKKDLDSKCADLESKIIILESKINEKEQKLNSKDMELAKYLKDLNVAQEDNKSLKNQLELAQKEGNKKSLLDLEMADYERSITELNNKIKKKDDEIEDLQNEIQLLKEKNDCLHEELKTTESLKETESKRAESLREILEKTKSELNEVKEHEAELLSKAASLEVRLESMTQQEEHLKIQLSETSAQIQHFQDVIKSSSENHQRIVRSLEQKISNQKEEILVAHKEVESVKQEFENYKIRVHSVLKQQKSVPPPIASVESDIKEKLETVNEKLKLQVKELSEKLTAMALEHDSLQEEYRNLLQRYDKLVKDRDQKDKEWNHRLELINAEKSRLRAAQEELSNQHLLQNEMLVATYKKQIKIMSEEHKKIVNDLQKQLDAADVEISRLQRDQQKLQGLPVTPSPQESATSFDLLSQERQEGEGSENTDETNTPIKHLSLATIPTSGFLSFEKLLQSPVEPGTPASYVSAYDAEKLVSDLNTANKKIDHLSELLNDSESTNMRMSEQVRVLKDEVRRLENNKERQQHAENLEYLKNVFIKFATLQPGSERAMLIPVLTTMLKLNSNEQQQLKSVAGDVQPDDNMNSGWGSYLHRWSGLS